MSSYAGPATMTRHAGQFRLRNRVVNGKTLDTPIPTASSGALRSLVPSGTGIACHSTRSIALQGLTAPAIHPLSKLRGILAGRVNLADGRRHRRQVPALDLAGQAGDVSRHRTCLRGLCAVHP
jgi:hypothetical protein